MRAVQVVAAISNASLVSTISRARFAVGVTALGESGDGVALPHAATRITNETRRIAAEMAAARATRKREQRCGQRDQGFGAGADVRQPQPQGQDGQARRTCTALCAST